MAYSRLLLLLIGVISFHLLELQARPIDFWCSCQARKNMEEGIQGLMADCVGSDTLSSPVQLPCVWINPEDWANKSLQQKRAEVAGSLQMFQDGVEGARNQNTSQNQTSLLDRLARHITNYLAIIDGTSIQDDTMTPSHSAVEKCSTQTSLTQVLKEYRKLLRGKLERFTIDLQCNICKTVQNCTT